MGEINNIKKSSNTLIVSTLAPFNHLNYTDMYYENLITNILNDGGCDCPSELAESITILTNNLITI